MVGLYGAQAQTGRPVTPRAITTWLPSLCRPLDCLVKLVALGGPETRSSWRERGAAIYWKECTTGTDKGCASRG